MPRGVRQRAVAVQAAADRLVARSVAYAESAVDGVELDADVSVTDMLKITGIIAQAFVVGYAAGRDDQAPAVALGGPREDAARNARRAVRK